MRAPAAIKLHPRKECPCGPAGVAPRSTGPITFARVTAICQRGTSGPGRRPLGRGDLPVAAPRAAAAQERRRGRRPGGVLPSRPDRRERRPGGKPAGRDHRGLPPPPAQPVLSLRPEVLFSAQGRQDPDPDHGTDDRGQAGRHRAGLPRAPAPGPADPAARALSARRSSAGPRSAIQIGCDFLHRRRRLTANRDLRQETSAGVREWDFGWIAGAAVEMHLPRTTLALQGRYSAGLPVGARGPGGSEEPGDGGAVRADVLKARQREQ